MPTLTRPPSRDLTAFPCLERRLSMEETYILAQTAQRKSSSEATRNDLRLRVGHANVLELLLNEIANSPPPSPTMDTSKPDLSKHIVWASLEVSKNAQHTEAEPEYEYDDGEEDLAGLTLVKTPTRRPPR